MTATFWPRTARLAGLLEQPRPGAGRRPQAQAPLLEHRADALAWHYRELTQATCAWQIFGSLGYVRVGSCLLPFRFRHAAHSQRAGPWEFPHGAAGSIRGKNPHWDWLRNVNRRCKTWLPCCSSCGLGRRLPFRQRPCARNHGPTDRRWSNRFAQSDWKWWRAISLTRWRALGDDCQQEPETFLSLQSAVQRATQRTAICFALGRKSAAFSRRTMSTISFGSLRAREYCCRAP